MKRLQVPITVLIITSFFSCSAIKEAFDQNFREVRYFVSTIREIERKKITLNNNTVWQTDRLFIGVNMSEVFVMLDEIRNRGWMYYRDTKIGLTQLDGSFFPYKTGRINYIKSFPNNGAVIELSGGTMWIVPLNKREQVKGWLLNTEIIISEDEQFIINPEKMDFIETVRLETKIVN